MHRGCLGLTGEERGREGGASLILQSDSFRIEGGPPRVP